MEISVLKVLLVFILIKMHYTALIVERSVCTAIDSNFSRFEVCEVTRNRQNIPVFNMKLRLLQVPVTNCIINMEILQIRQTNSLSLFNATWDACKFMTNKRMYPSSKFFYEMMAKFSNLNHTCPYNHDVLINNLVPLNMFMPIPKGNYNFKSGYIVGGQKRLSVDIYVLSN